VSTFFQYQDCEVGIKAARILKEQEDTLESQYDDNDDELLDAEFYWSSPLELDTKTEFTWYLKLLVMSQETNIHHFWKAKQFEFPIISKIAWDFLTIPATLAPSECVFSIGSDVVTKKRNRLTGDSVRMIMCLKDSGIIADEDVEDEMLHGL
jgi:hypothetical protein